jgi:glycosyltransferase involved in cell wall biosynthesis
MLGISVVLCCYNSATRLPETLAHLQAQTGLQNVAWEVILVDNASKDNTVAVAKHSWQGFEAAPLHLVYEPQAGLAHARKAGFAKAKYAYICMVDDDNWLIANYLQTIFNIFETKPNVGACGGWGEAVFEPNATVPFWYDRFKNGYAVGKMAEEEKILTGEKEFLYGAGMCMRKEIWEKLKKSHFESMLLGRTADKVTSGEDVELGYVIRLLGYDLLFSPLLQFKHLMASNRLGWQYLKKLKKGFGSSAIYHGFYKNLLYPSGLRTQIRFYWFAEFMLALGILVAKSLIYLPNLLKKEEGNAQWASFYHSLGRVAEMWALCGNYAGKQKQVNLLAARLKNCTIT